MNIMQLCRPDPNPACGWIQHPTGTGKETIRLPLAHQLCID